MKWISRCAIAVLLILCAHPQAGLAAKGVRGSVVKVYTVRVVQDYDEPWKSLFQQSIHGSGCVIEGKRILTTAHVVADQIYIQVRKSGEAKKYTARVKAVAHECDLALLEVEDESFFHDTPPLEVGELAALGDEVTAYGFPQGGDKLCTTQGVVSRVEHTRYAHSKADLLACQIDAAINPGSSGGPVVEGNGLVGIAFGGAEGDNIGYMIPPPVIRHFLQDLEDGAYGGIPSLGVSVQKMENPGIRKKYGMEETTTGVLVNRVHWGSPAQDLLAPGDVIVSVSGVDVENDGTVAFREGERTHFEYLVQQRFMGETIRLKVLRNGKVVDVDVPLTKRLHFERLVPSERHDVTPTYCIFGGLVFEPLTENYLMIWGAEPYEKAPSNLTDCFLNGVKSEDRKEVVLLVKVLADKINVGYHNLKNRVVSKVNGVDIANMHELVEALERHDGKYHEIVDDKGYRIVLDAADITERNQNILETFRILSGKSEDLE